MMWGDYRDDPGLSVEVESDDLFLEELLGVAKIFLENTLSGRRNFASNCNQNCYTETPCPDGELYPQW
jgi:hypothetical protein